MIQALCFDFDGTLAHFQGDFLQLLDAFRTELMLGQCDMNAFSEVLSSELRAAGQVSLLSATTRTLQKLEQRIPLDLTEIVGGTLNDYSAQVILLPGAQEVLELVSHLPLALVSNGPSDMQRAALEKVGIEPYFKTVVVSGDEDVAVRKPNPRIFELACERLDVPPEEVLMIGDNLEADVQGALAAGLQAVRLGISEVEDITKVSDLTELHTYLRENFRKLSHARRRLSTDLS